MNEPRSVPTIGTNFLPLALIASTTSESMPDVQMPSMSSYPPLAMNSLISLVAVAGSQSVWTPSGAGPP